MLGEPIRVVVVEDDADVAELVRTVLVRRLECDVRVLGSAFGFDELLRSFSPHVLITDIELPGASGLDLIAAARAIRAEQPVIVMTAHASVDYAVRALRDQADEFLTKPIASGDLVAAVARLAERDAQNRAARRSRTVLAIGAHPDDVEIGIGGTLAAHAAAGDPVAILTLSRGGRGGTADDRQHESIASAELLGARLFLEDLEDTRIGGDATTVGIIERVIADVAPSIVYTHSKNDRHQDHRAVHEATMVASRRVDGVACYQSPSTTIDFRPSRFVSIDGFIDTKLALLACFGSQTAIREYLEPDFVLATARYWSRFGTSRTAEPLEVVRDASGIGTGSGSGAAPAEATTAQRREDPR